MTVGIGVIGAGLIGQKRALNLPASARLQSVFDPSESALKSFSTRLGNDYVVASTLGQLIQSDSVDAVIIATPHHLLSPLAIDAIRAKKHCLIEKPGGISSVEIQAIHQEAERNGVLIRYGFNHRFHPAVQQLKSIVQSEKYGPILSIRAVYGHGGRPGYEKEWRSNRSLSGGGELIDQGSHLIDLVHFLGGGSKLRFSHLATSFWDMRVEDNAFLALELPNGALGWLHASWTEWKNTFRLEVSMRQARADIVGLGGSYGTEHLILHEMKPEMGPPITTEHSFTEDESWRLELQDFIDAINGRDGLGATSSDALAVWSVVEDAYSS